MALDYFRIIALLTPQQIRDESYNYTTSLL
ncbi:MAG: hypothetical protein UV58_C0006G0001 [Candidatus Wolfebacteria bacterium GW2011_GWC1_43_10]|uniref:Uncharacterized protein n=1 Tax=Candidatus Wolfebacteria bacterium GW2011_GWC1_43_10 TaxID=1619011 RepID=A0A0G1CAY9_9BACT|nr:MAG: hypothetical protein UV58_C0006G0001 [Candidatus Wolfebacteria bacterium GW2011_GWC1_43_10]KKT22907.1 MAG: hypothetical protein UW08_C0002G0036 [Parcubacteria group bacterium GW2011_GWB1_43_8b]